MIFNKALIVLTIFHFSIINVCIAQQSPSFTTAIERQFNKIESDIVSSAEAMPADKFYFTPESLNITNSDFKGVQHFCRRTKAAAQTQPAKDLQCPPTTDSFNFTYS